jgi:hypothetical protein
MHFRRARRQRSIFRATLGFAASGVSFADYRQAPWGVRVKMRVWSGFWIGAGSRWGRTPGPRSEQLASYHPPISGLHAFRNEYWSFFSEEGAIDRWMATYHDHYLRHKILVGCAANPHLRHLTEDYLDRIYKLRIFL